MAGVLRPAGCHRHLGIIRSWVSVIQGAGKSSGVSPGRASASGTDPGLLHTFAIRPTTPPSAGRKPLDPNTGQGAQKKQGTVGIIEGFRRTQHYAATGSWGPVFFWRKSGFSVDSETRMVKGIGRRISAVTGCDNRGPVEAVISPCGLLFSNHRWRQPNASFSCPARARPGYR